MDACASDSCMESNDNDRSDGKCIASECDILSIWNEKMDAENLSGDARTKRGWILFRVF